MNKARVTKAIYGPAIELSSGRASSGSEDDEVINSNLSITDPELLQFPVRWVDGEDVYIQETQVQNMAWLNENLEVKRTKFGNIYFLTNPVDNNRYKVHFITPRSELDETFIISWRANVCTNARAVMLRNF